MIALISRWKLRNGCPEELERTLTELARKVTEGESGTLAYAVHLSAPSPPDAAGAPIEPPPPPIPLDQQADVVFFEVYRDAEAFHDHLTGTVFTGFLDANRHHFYADPADPSWPDSDTTFLSRQSAEFRDEPG